MERLDETVVYNTPIEDTFDGWDYKEPNVAIEVDDELGLPLVNTPTIFEKYGIQLDPTTNNFHKSLQSFYDSNSYLTPKQLNCFK